MTDAKILNQHDTTNMSRRRYRVLGALAFLSVIAYAPAILAAAQGNWPFADDAIGMMSVWRDFTRDALRHGVLPLWNPYLFCGMPFMSNGQAAVLYAPNILYWTLPIYPALVLDAVAHNIFLAFGAYALARALGLSRTASFVTALALSLGSGVASHIYVGHMTWHAARAYIPWELWALLLYLKSGRRRYAIVLAALFGLQSTAGYPPMLVLGAGLCCGLLIAWSVVHLWRRVRQGRAILIMPRGWIAAALLTSLLAASLCAVNFLPLRETSRLSPHGAGLSYEDAVLMSGNWHSLVRMAMPEFFGGNRGLQWSLEFNAHEEAAYVGLLTLVLALGAPFFARRTLPGSNRSYLPAAVPWLWALLPFVALLAMGDNTPFFRWMHEHISLLRLTRVPVRWLEVWCLCAALLAGFSFDGCIHRGRANRAEKTADARTARALLMAFGALTALLIALLFALGLTPPESRWWMETAQWNILNNNPARRVANANRLYAIAVQEAVLTLVLSLVLALILLKWRQAVTPQRQARSATWIVIILAADLLLVFWRSAITITPAQFQQNAQWPAGLVRYYDSEYRWDTGVAWPAINRGMPHHIDLFNGYDALGSKRYFEFAGAVEGKEFWTDSYQVGNYSPLLRVAGVTHTLSTILEPTRGWKPPQLQAQAGNWKLWRHEGAWPRVYLTRRLVRATPVEQLTKLSTVAQQDFKSSGQPAIVGMDDFSSVRYSPLTSGDTFQRRSRGWNTRTVETYSTAPSLLVQSEALSPGWRAWVNGRPAELSAANFLFRGVPVPAGQSLVVVVYDTQTFRFSLFLTLCGLTALSAMGMVFFKRGSGVLRPRLRPQ